MSMSKVICEKGYCRIMLCISCSVVKNSALNCFKLPEIIVKIFNLLQTCSATFHSLVPAVDPSAVDWFLIGYKETPAL